MAKTLVNKLKKKKVLLLGDFILDEFLFGVSERISPEAPVPVIIPQESDFSLGGAGNVLSNLSNLGVDIIPLGILGTDSISKKIFYFLKKKKINFKNFIIDKKYKGIRKKRIVVRNQHIARLDYELINFQIPIKYEKKIKTKIFNLIKKKCDIVIISDYGKGNLTDDVIKYTIETANKFEIPIIVDPRKKNNDYSIYSNATFITPNLNELRNIFPSLSNEHLEIMKAAEVLKNKYLIKNILVTRGEYGISFYSDYFKTHVKSVAKEVYDVSGAGDTVVATLAICILLKINIKKAIKLMNLCAGYVISFRGTKPITYDQFEKFIHRLQ
jgi:D-beta-D-heptose 7-phosphate kinase/D-beta-D-heptose 1-phosphate adenosyltransferase